MLGVFGLSGDLYVFWLAYGAFGGGSCYRDFRLLVISYLFRSVLAFRFRVGERYE